VDQERGLSPLHGHEVAYRKCRSCAIARSACTQATGSLVGYVAEAVDDEAVVISRPGLDGLVVLPRQHISGLEELTVPRRASVLAALRRATESVRDRNPGWTSRVVVMTDPPASRGHVCFEVVRSRADANGGPLAV
jgi:hypothetical protein